MKKTLLLIILLTFSLLGCSSKYEGYQEVKIPDEMLGTIMMPNNWQFEVINEWIYIMDNDTGSIIAFQYYKGLYYWVGTEEHNELIFNPQYDGYEKLSVVKDLTGNSNLSNCNLFEFNIDGENSEILGLYFTSNIDFHYSIEFIFIALEINQKILINIADSYNPENID
ncbi:MAG: hypothetical protein PHF05_08790 [Candidatus Izemoplasmatales bacterium]|nr:hypothetical protein [Candidatus Izemoplasmatales bacterium]